MEAKSFSFSKMAEGEDFLFPPSLSHAEIKKLLDESKDGVRAANKEVFALLESGHKASAALELKNKLILLDKYMTDLADFLDDRLDGTENTEKEITLKMFRKTCDQLTNRVDKMNRMLDADIYTRHHLEAKKAKDPIKVVTYLIGLPTLASNLAKIFFDEKSPMLPYIAITSVIGGIWGAFPEESKSMWFTARKTVCGGKQMIQNSFLLYYARSTIQEKTAETKIMARKLFGASDNVL